MSQLHRNTQKPQVGKRFLANLTQFLYGVKTTYYTLRELNSHHVLVISICEKMAFIKRSFF